MNTKFRTGNSTTVKTFGCTVYYAWGIEELQRVNDRICPDPAGKVVNVNQGWGRSVKKYPKSKNIKIHNHR